MILCGLEWQAPSGARIIADEQNLSSFEKDYRQGGTIHRFHCAVACQDNLLRTSGIELELKNSADSRVQRTERLTMDSGIDGIVYSRIRIIDGRRQKRIQAYAATRDFEYRVACQAAEPAADFDYQPLALDIIDMMQRARFRTPVQSTITEARFRSRLRTAIILGASGLVALATLGLLALRHKRRGRVAAASKAPAADN
ncbi:MAG: hypothetical protein K1X75_14080 [Leptospirales bacterium]|nr:hypothetical protein [Leptospirales bacterium]